MLTTTLDVFSVTVVRMRRTSKTWKSIRNQITFEPESYPTPAECKRTNQFASRWQPCNMRTLLRSGMHPFDCEPFQHAGTLDTGQPKCQSLYDRRFCLYRANVRAYVERKCVEVLTNRIRESQGCRPLKVHQSTARLCYDIFGRVVVFCVVAFMCRQGCWASAAANACCEGPFCCSGCAEGETAM
ncbi:hypothetical protein LX32DRAFT_35311 [Colletotrichum zoysiae]|uniref:Uncharacterized protein n=1 Tax=Colletotrichum zoysiae TaxID=1216348 RepID=A0AAD9HC16_9PEZI|nr:hypothetical protein LX32DRAFT_35311 [Colletotrichum zoysiae]